MKLYNTRTRSIQDFTPIDGETVRIYSCGPTVYNHAHIGNLSAYIFADTLHRTVILPGWKVEHAMNYTDVDDKTIRRSGERYPDDEPRAALKKLTDQFIDIFLGDMRRIGNDVDSLTFVRATDTISDMQELITRLHAAGFAYIAEDGVYFSIESYKQAGKIYGQLLELTSANTSEARIHNDEYDKESVHDFALWKKRKEGEPAWPFSLEGVDLSGRPGWHIECSAMSRLVLGQPFDIHTGGIDLIFPHHENEIAQSTALESDPTMAAFFMHNDHILIDGKKMAKSANNFLTLEDIVTKGYDPLAFRLVVLQGHYRSQINFTWESLEAAENRLRNWQAIAVLRYQTVDHDTGISYGDYITWADEDVRAPMLQDLNTPQVLANISQRLAVFGDKLVSSADPHALRGFEAYLEAVDEILGLNLMAQQDITAAQKELITAREKARENKDWNQSDKLRDQLTEQGIALRDTPHGPIWYRL
jgi:cysteinyl-tRNA synthetase